MNKKIKVAGITNNCNFNPERYVLFYEFDKINTNYLLEIVRRVSAQFKLNFYVFKSSMHSYHIIGFDLLEKKKIVRLQNNFATEKDDYLPLDAVELLRSFPYGVEHFNVLRVTTKDGKKPIKFYKKIGSWNTSTNDKSITHYYVYNNIAKGKLDREKGNWIVTHPKIIVYKTNV